MPRLVVFDTNILISAVGWKGKPFECLELARRGTVIGVTCPELLDEFSSKLQTKLSFSEDEALATLIDLLSFVRVIKIHGTLKAVPSDPDDDKTLECAIISGASHIVTGDRRHLLPLKNFQGVEIVTPAEYLAEISDKPR